MFCSRRKEFLSQHGIAFEERHVSSDEAALEELQRRGLMTTPVTLVDGEEVVGFDRARLAKMFGLKELLIDPPRQTPLTHSSDVAPTRIPGCKKIS
jgi:glutaredoxin 3